MEEILRNASKIREILQRRNGLEMTEEEYCEQRDSFIVGNAFDVFSDSEVVNRDLLRDIEVRRLQVAR